MATAAELQAQRAAMIRQMAGQESQAPQLQAQLAQQLKAQSQADAQRTTRMQGNRRFGMGLQFADLPGASQMGKMLADQAGAGLSKMQQSQLAEQLRQRKSTEDQIASEQQGVVDRRALAQKQSLKGIDDQLAAMRTRSAASTPKLLGEYTNPNTGTPVNVYSAPDGGATIGPSGAKIDPTEFATNWRKMTGSVTAKPKLLGEYINPNTGAPVNVFQSPEGGVTIGPGGAKIDPTEFANTWGQAPASRASGNKITSMGERQLPNGKVVDLYHNSAGVITVGPAGRVVSPEDFENSTEARDPVKLDAATKKEAKTNSDALLAIDNALDSFDESYGRNEGGNVFFGPINPRGGGLESLITREFPTAVGPEARKREQWWAQHADQYQADKIHERYGGQLTGNELALWTSFKIGPNMMGEDIKIRLNAMKRFAQQKQEYGEVLALAEGVPLNVVQAAYFKGTPISEVDLMGERKGSVLGKTKTSAKQKSDVDSLHNDAERAEYRRLTGGGQ